MAAKENHDLFSQLSSNEGSLPLDFDKNAKFSEPSGEEAEKKANIPDSNSMKSSPRLEKSEPQRRPTHHVPPPYKKTVQETAAAEPKNEVEPKNDIVVQNNPIEKPDLVPVNHKDEAKPAAAGTGESGKPVSASMPSSTQSEIPLRTPAPAVLPNPAGPGNPASAPVVNDKAPAPAVQVEETPDVPPSPKQARHPKTQHIENADTAKTERQTAPVVQVKTDVKPQIPAVKQQDVKSSHVPKNTAPASDNKEVASPVAAVSHDRKAPVEQKAAKSEPQKPVKKATSPEKFSTDNATVGQLLQEGRVRAGLSIEQASSSTKIKKTFIESLERDDFENLPASVYVNAYTRALCSLYNIDAKMVFGLLNKVKGKSLDHTVPEEVIHQLEKGKQVNIDQENKIKRAILIGFAACFTVVALILVTYYFMNMSRKTSSSSTTTAKPVISTESAVQPSINAGISAKTLEQDMEKKLMAPHVFTMTSLPLAER